MVLLFTYPLRSPQRLSHFSGPSGLSVNFLVARTLRVSCGEPGHPWRSVVQDLLPSSSVEEAEEEGEKQEEEEFECRH